MDHQKMQVIISSQMTLGAKTQVIFLLVCVLVAQSTCVNLRIPHLLLW